MNGYIHELNLLNDRPEQEGELACGGDLHLNGIQTLAYVRVRYVGRDDFERTQRQRIVAERMLENVKKLNLFEISDLLNEVLPEISTNLSEGEIASLLLKTPSYLDYSICELRIPADGTYEAMRIRGMEVLGLDLEKNREVLRTELYGEGIALD